MAGWLHSIGFLDCDWRLLGSGLSGARSRGWCGGGQHTPAHTHTHPPSRINIRTRDPRKLMSKFNQNIIQIRTPELQIIVALLAARVGGVLNPRENDRVIIIICYY